MGFGQTFCRKISNRSYQYAVRSVYDVFKPEKIKVKSAGNSEVKRSTQKSLRKEKSVEYGCDKNGVRYNGHTFAIYQGKEFQIIEHTAKMVTLSDGKKRRMSSVEFKHAYEIENWQDKEVITVL